MEVHAQLMTKSKLFCGDAISFGAEPNTQVSPISLAHPGTLPVMNKAVMELAVKLGIALNCNITQHNYFARKNYFYADLPKGYQVSQHTAPVCTGGWLSVNVDGSEKKVILNRIHMEEDAGKSLHDQVPGFSCIDLNRAGTPLLEIVTEPCMHSPEEAFAFLTELRKLIRWINVCDGNMEEGSMRCDANISVRLIGETKLGTRVEVKNLNSIRNVKKAIELEVERLIDLTEKGETILQQTRSFDADKLITFALRSKEEADDYRYFPEPDLPPFFLSDAYIKDVAAQLPVLPEVLERRYKEIYGLSAYDAAVICSDKEQADFFESIINNCTHYKAVANWIHGPVKAWCNEQDCQLTDFPLRASALAELINFTESGKISFNIASSRVLHAMIKTGEIDPSKVAGSMNLLQESDEDAVTAWVKVVLATMPEKVAEFKSGKKNLLGLFAGQVKKISQGKADMQLVNKILNRELNN